MVQYATIFAKKLFVSMVYKCMIMKDLKKTTFDEKNFSNTWINNFY